MNRFRTLLVLCLCACSGACSGGGIDTGNGIAAQGVVAEGAAAAFVDVTIRGVNGETVQTATDADGNYSADVATLEAPYFVRADLGGGKLIYAFARKSDEADSGAGAVTVVSDSGVETAEPVVVMNVHPFSDLLIGTYYRAQGLDLDLVFENFGSGSLYPSRDEIENIIAPISDVFIRAFPGGDLGFLSGTVAYGSDGLALETAFTPDGTGFDALLDALTVLPDRSGFTIVNGDLQVDTVIATGTSGSVPQLVFQTTTVGPDGSSADQQTLILPSDEEFRLALAGVRAAFKKIVDTAILKGPALTASDLVPQFAIDYLDGGEGRLLAAARMAGLLRGKAVGVEALRPIFYDRILGIMRVGLGPVPQFVDTPVFTGSTAPLDAPPSDPSAPPPPDSPPPFLILRRPPGEFVFKRVGAQWLLFGDQSLARREILSISRTTMTAGGNTQESILVANAVSPNLPSPMITAGQIKSLPDGTGLFPAVTNLNLLPQSRSELLRPTGSAADNYTMAYDVYSILQVLGPTPPGVGSDFVITITPASLPPENPMVQNRPIHASTTEPAMIVVPTGHTMADAIPSPGTPIQVRWTLPRSYPIVSIQLIAKSRNGALVCAAQPVELVGSAAPDRATVPVPPYCPGPPVSGTPTSAEIELIVRGPHGEQSEVRYEFQ